MPAQDSGGSNKYQGSAAALAEEEEVEAKAETSQEVDLFGSNGIKSNGMAGGDAMLAESGSSNKNQEHPEVGDRFQIWLPSESSYKSRGPPRKVSYKGLGKRGDVKNRTTSCHQYGYLQYDDKNKCFFIKTSPSCEYRCSKLYAPY